MPVHNALPHLDQAVESILNQTFTDFEFVILDDASTDGSRARLEYWAGRDPRIRLLHVDQNLGPVRSSNMVAEAARAELVARMDADDISYPDRFRRQVEVLRQNPRAGVVGGLCDMIDASGTVLRPPEGWRISRRSPFVPFAHGAMMYRRAIFERIGGYRDECAYWEDQDLVVRMAAVSDVLVMPEAVYCVRAWTSSTRIASDSKDLEHALQRMYAAIDRLRENGEYVVPQKDVPDDAKVDPRVLMSMGSVRLWANGKPRLFRRLLKRGDLSFNARSMAALVWTAWASTSPGSLRAFLKLLLSLRNRTSSAAGTPDHVIAWTPFKDSPRPQERPAAAAGQRSAV